MCGSRGDGQEVWTPCQITPSPGDIIVLQAKRRWWAPDGPLRILVWTPLPSVKYDLSKKKKSKFLDPPPDKLSGPETEGTKITKQYKA